MLISVRREDIERGERDRCHACPIARAMKRHGFVDPFVEVDHVTWLDGDMNKTVALSTRATRFINAFDAGRKVRPFTFRLRTGSK